MHIMYIIMYKYIDNYANTNHVTQFQYPLPLPLPLPLSHSIPVILSGQLYVKHKTIVGNVVYIQFVILAIGITFSCLTTIV